MCKKLVLVLVLGLLTSVAGANTWKIDFQGDENHGGTYNQTDPVDMTEPGVYWNIFEVPALFEPWNPPIPHITPPYGMALANTDGELTGVTFLLNTLTWGKSGLEGADALTGDWITIKHPYGGVDNDPTDWAILGLEPDTQYALTYYHGEEAADMGIAFSANGVDTLIIGLATNATALVTTDEVGRIIGTANTDAVGFWAGQWAGLVIVPEPATIALLGLGGLVLIRRRRA